MTYELSLEYGCYPVKEIDAFLVARKTAPDFLKDNSSLCAKLEDLNQRFHELFLTIECTFHYMGSQHPDKIAQIKALYEEVAEELLATYPEQAIRIEHFILS